MSADPKCNYRGVLLFGAMALAVFSYTGATAAQVAKRDAVAAESLFEEARKLMNAGKFPEACPKLEESQRLDPAVGTLMYLGLCYEQSGRTASAWSTYRAAESEAAQAAQGERARIAHDRAEALSRKLTKLVIRVSANPEPGLQIFRDGVQLGQASLGLAVPIDPGKHTITARALGKLEWSVTVDVSAGTPETAVDVPALKDLPSVPPAAGATRADSNSAHAGAMVANGNDAPSTLDRDHPPSSAGATQRAAGIVVGAAGVVGIGLGAVFAARSSSKSDQAEKYRVSGTNIYDGPGYDYNQQALSSRTAAIVSFSVGGAAIVGGTLLYLTAPRARSNPARFGLQPEVGPSMASLSFHGAW